MEAEDKEAEEEDVQEARRPAPIRQPRAPTKQELADHLPHHLPYRDWCRHCVEGKATGIQHRTEVKKDTDGAMTMSMDYCFMTAENEEQGVEPILMMFDERTRGIWAVPVDNKGVKEWIVKWCNSKIEEAGYMGKELTLKTDGEPALMELKRAVMAKRVGVTVPVESPVRQSKCNGGMERAIRTWQAQYRTLKIYFEEKIEKKMGLEHELSQWLAMWTGDMMNLYKVHPNGRTQYEMATGHKVKKGTPAFGEEVLFRLAADKKQYKSESDWDVGIFVGVICRTQEMILMTKDGLFKTINVKRQTEENQYDKECLEWAKTKIDDFVDKGAQSRPRVRLGDEIREGMEIRTRPDFAPRRLRLDRADFEKHGFTEGCPACIRMQIGLGARRVHSEECRKRMQEELEADDTTRDRVQRSAERAVEWRQFQEAAQPGGGDDEAQEIEPMIEENMIVEDGGDISENDTNGGDMDLNGLNVKDKKIMSAILRGVDITEVYSPERVAEACKRFGMIPGSSMDIRTGFDFDRSEDRRRARDRVRSERPTLLVGSPPCTMFSLLQELAKACNRDKPGWLEAHEAKVEKAKRHIRFCCELYQLQQDAGRYFLHEHPWSAKSWNLDCIDRIRNAPGVRLVQSNMCRYGMESFDPEAGVTKPVLKPTGFMTNSWCIATELDKKCDRMHEHTTLMSGRAAAAAVYPPALCNAICKGLQKQKAYDDTGKVCSMDLNMNQLSSIVNKMKKETDEIEKKEHWIDNKHEEDGTGKREPEGENKLNGAMNLLKHDVEGIEAYDDVTKGKLDVAEVIKARALEMKYFKDKGVYVKVPREHQRKTGGKIISTRWIDVNKGDSANPDYRSRLVGKEFKDKNENELYASTPPLEGLRAVVSWAATWSTTTRRRRSLMINDVRRAYFNAKVQRDIYIELPRED